MNKQFQGSQRRGTRRVGKQIHRECHVAIASEPSGRARSFLFVDLGSSCIAPGRLRPDSEQPDGSHYLPPEGGHPGMVSYGRSRPWQRETGMAQDAVGSEIREGWSFPPRTRRKGQAALGPGRAKSEKTGSSTVVSPSIRAMPTSIRRSISAARRQAATITPENYFHLPTPRSVRYPEAEEP